MEDSGTFFSDKSDMGSKRNDTGSGNLGKNSDGSNVWSNDYNNNYHNITPLYKDVASLYKNLYKKDMAEAMALGWKLFYIFGFSSVTLSYLSAWRVTLLDISFDQMPYPFKNLMYFLSAIVLGITAWRGYQAGRKQRIANDQQEWENKQKRNALSKDKII